MSRKNVFLYDIDVPEIVQEKAEIAFSMIQAEGENIMKEQKTDKNLKRQKNRPAGKGAAKKLRTGILTAAACAAAVIAVVGLR